MRIGASTACFFPLVTEKALDNVLNLGFEQAEIFFNTSSELEDAFVKELKRNADRHNAKILSVHPFSSALESNCIFAEYERRYYDFVDLYKKHFHAAALLGAEVVVIHGSVAVQKRDLSDDFYFERFQRLVELGKREGVKVCQENVVRFRSQNMEFLKKMRNALGDDFHLVFDVKQALRSGYEPLVFLDEFKENVSHIHLSDNNLQADCLPPGKGNFDFKKLFDMMKSVDYKGGYVIEIYSKGLDIKKELALSKDYLERM